MKKKLLAGFGIFIGAIVLEATLHPGEKLGHKVSDLLKKGKDVEEDVVETAEETAEIIKDKAEDVIDAVVDKFTSGLIAIEEVKEEIREAIQIELERLEQFKDDVALLKDLEQILAEMREQQEFIRLLREDYVNWEDLRETAKLINEGHFLISEETMQERLEEWEILKKDVREACFEQMRELAQKQMGEFMNDLNNATVGNPAILGIQQDILDLERKLKEVNRSLADVKKLIPNKPSKNSKDAAVTQPS